VFILVFRVLDFIILVMFDKKENDEASHYTIISISVPPLSQNYDPPTVSRPIRLGVGHPFGAHDQILLFPFFFRKIALLFVLGRPL
jgi:hypothetical protein